MKIEHLEIIDFFDSNFKQIPSEEDTLLFWSLNENAAIQLSIGSIEAIEYRVSGPLKSLENNANYADYYTHVNTRFYLYKISFWPQIKAAIEKDYL